MRKITTEYGFLDVEALETVEAERLSPEIGNNLPLIGLQIVNPNETDADRIYDSIFCRLGSMIHEQLSGKETIPTFLDVRFTGVREGAKYLFSVESEDGYELVRSNGKVKREINGKLITYTPWKDGVKAYIGDNALKIAYKDAEKEVRRIAGDAEIIDFCRKGIVCMLRCKKKDAIRLIGCVYAHPIYVGEKIYIADANENL